MKDANNSSQELTYMYIEHQYSKKNWRKKFKKIYLIDSRSEFETQLLESWIFLLKSDKKELFLIQPVKFQCIPTI